MTPTSARVQFFESASEWLCDSYSLAINYLAIRDQGAIKILNALVVSSPLPPDKYNNFSIEAGSLLAGHHVCPSISKSQILEQLTEIANGILVVNGLELVLDTQNNITYQSELPNDETWFSGLNLLISGSHLNASHPVEVAKNNSALRQTNPPFDGIFDLCSWLQLSDDRIAGRAPSINLKIGAPVDIIFDESYLKSNTFQLVFKAHPKLDLSKIGLATKEFPGDGINTRKQSSNLIKWEQARNNYRPGILNLELTNADSILTMLSVSGQIVRRQWFQDPDRAQNLGYIATQLFDKQLKQLRQAVLDSSDSVRFEQGIASLLFLLGFSSAVQVETQSPDILFTTIGGKIGIIECTTKIADFQSKLGKLVDRRNSLKQTLAANGRNLRVDAFLVCGLPKAQIAAENTQLINHQITLLCREDIEKAFYKLRTPINPDEMLDRFVGKLAVRQQ